MEFAVRFRYNRAVHFDWQPLVDWYMASLDKGGYLLVALLMAIESSIIPLPSELVIPPVAHLAHKNGSMSLVGIVIAGTAGSWVGATAMYWSALSLGRPLIMAYGKYVMISPEKVAGAERWATRFGSPGIFLSRLLPVVRHLIGIPAGIVKMEYWRFSLFTLLGSAVWCSVLAWVGVKAGQDEKLLQGDLKHLMMWILPAALLLCGLWYFGVQRFMRVPSPAGGRTRHPSPELP